jgi:hypothetical protein
MMAVAFAVNMSRHAKRAVTEGSCQKRAVKDAQRALFVQDLVHEGDGDRALAYRRGYAFHVAGAYVADGKDAGAAGFEEVRPPREWPVRGFEIFGSQVGTGLDEAMLSRSPSARTIESRNARPTGAGQNCG